MKISRRKRLIIPGLMEVIAQLPSVGRLAITADMLVYLTVDNNYINQVFPLLPANVGKPDYFGLNGIGAHISVIYPEENVILAPEEFGKTYSFKVTGLHIAKIVSRGYYVLSVVSPDLIALRSKYGLGKKLCLKQHFIDLHITIGMYDW